MWDQIIVVVFIALGSAADVWRFQAKRQPRQHASFRVKSDADEIIISHLFDDASKGSRKDGPKNRLHDQDIHKIVDTYRKQDESDPRYVRIVPLAEIADLKNGNNLNLPRCVDSTEPEDLQDIDGHLRGGIPECDLDALGDYWQVMPALRAAFFEVLRPGWFA
jgi:type I restriction-modification system DNA methylase subunit